MLGFANLALIGGLLAVAAPILIHIAHQRRARPVAWGAMRFLRQVVSLRQRQLRVDDRLLLVTRCAILLTASLALMRPVWHAAASTAGWQRSGPVAGAVVIDDSLSATAGRAEPVFNDLRALAIDYVETLGKGDEISVIIGSQRHARTADPMFSVIAARAIIAQTASSPVATDMVALIHAGLDQLSRHVNPHPELVVITDGTADGWQDLDAPRWQELRRRLASGEPGRSAPRVAIVAPAPRAPGLNVAVTHIGLDRALVPVGRSVGITAVLECHGDSGSERTRLLLSVDGRVIGERQLELTAPSRREEVFPHVFSAAGSHIIEARIEGARDLLAQDDARTVAVEVEAGVGVLLVEGTPGQGTTGSLGLVAAALDPVGAGGSLFRVQRSSAARFERADLEGMRVVILGDVQALEPAAVAALESFVVAGGGILVALGPQTDLALADRFWARGGSGFLPPGLTRIRQNPQGLAVVSVTSAHPTLAPFLDPRTNDPWRGVQVYQQVLLEPARGQGTANERLLTTEDGADLLVLRRRGHGQVALWTSTLDAAWTDLPAHPAFVPLLRGVVAELGAVILPPRNLRPGDRLTWIPPRTFTGALDLAGPGGKGIEIQEGTWEGRRAFFSSPAVQPGAYHLRGPGVDVRFAIAADPAESTLAVVTSDMIAAALGPEVRLVHGAAAMGTTFVANSRSGWPWWRCLVLASVLCLVVESLLTASTAQRGQRSP